MAWETRNGKRYYYRKVWQNGTCKSEYVGAGLVGDLAAILDKEKQADKASHSRERREAWDSDLDRQINQICNLLQQVVSAALVVTGHYKHKGTWRKRRVNKQRDVAEAALKRLSTGKGTEQDRKHFRTALKEVPAMLAEIDVVPQVIRQTIATMAGNDQSARIAWNERTYQIQRELGYTEASIIERLLIEQIILCRLRLYWVEYFLSTRANSVNAATMEHWERRASASQRRYLRAIETLARVRKLAARTPEILQINIGQNQVNQVAQ